MKCRVPAPLSPIFRREAASRSPFRPLARGSAALQRRLRIVRHRALRWFHDPVAGRRQRALGPSLWLYGFRPWPVATARARSERSALRSIG